MKKKIAVLLTAILVSATLICPYALLNVQATYEHRPRMIDDADLLDSEVATEFLNKLEEISERQMFDVVILTVNSLDGEDIQYFAADYYDNNAYGMGENDDGAMFVMSMEEREWFILTTGSGIDILTDREIDAIGEMMVPYLSNGEYAEAFTIFADEVDAQVEYGVEAPEETKPSILISLAAGLVLGLIPAFIMRGKLKSVRMQTSAGRYEDRGSRNVTTRQDIFLYHTVNRVPKSDESRSGGGGSSTFRGSSGRSHGGRGGGF